MTSIIQTTETDLDRRLCLRLQDLRTARNWSLDDLARDSGISRATLSRIERGETSPTATQLGRLCTAFGITMSGLLGGLDEPSDEFVAAANQRLWVDPATGFRRRMVSPPVEGLRVELIESELPAGAVVAYDAPPIPGMEQHVWMLSGALDLTWEGKTQALAPGDCLRFRIWGGVRFKAGPKGARYLVAVCRS